MKLKVDISKEVVLEKKEVGKYKLTYISNYWRKRFSKKKENIKLDKEVTDDNWWEFVW